MTQVAETLDVPPNHAATSCSHTTVKLWQKIKLCRNLPTMQLEDVSVQKCSLKMLSGNAWGRPQQLMAR